MRSRYGNHRCVHSHVTLSSCLIASVAAKLGSDDIVDDVMLSKSHSSLSLLLSILHIRCSR